MQVLYCLSRANLLRKAKEKKKKYIFFLLQRRREKIEDMSSADYPGMLYNKM